MARKAKSMADYVEEIENHGETSISLNYLDMENQILLIIIDGRNSQKS